MRVAGRCDSAQGVYTPATMADVAPSSRRVRFGPFEADLHTRELRKHGMRLRLQEQPFQILAMLLERPGETGEM